jgi:hypothetical protein
MKISHIYTAPLLTIVFTTVVCRGFITRDKRSVFDMTTNLSEEDNSKNSSNISSKYYKHTIVLSKVMDDEKGIKYQDLKNIFLSSRNKQKQEAKRNQWRKEEVKKQFLAESKEQNKTRFDKENKENIIVNFSFLTKLSW